MRRASFLLRSIIPSLLLAGGIIYAAAVFFGYEKGRRAYRDVEDTYTRQIDTPGKTDPGGPRSDQNPERAHTGGRMTESEREERTEDAIPADAPDRISIDWDALLQRNEDVVGWIFIPAVSISYPVVQSGDNEFYLHRGIDKEYLYAGCIFLDPLCDRTLKDYNSVVYGHNMRDGSMFARLKDFLAPDTVKKCPYFWIFTPGGDFLYWIVSVHAAAPGSDTYTVRFRDYESYAAWIEKMVNLSGSVCGAGASAGDRLVTLSTCTNDSSARMVVQGKLVWSARAEEDQTEH